MEPGEPGRRHLHRARRENRGSDICGVACRLTVAPDSLGARGKFPYETSLGERLHAAVRVVDHEPLLRPEELVRDDQRADGVVGDVGGFGGLFRPDFGGMKGRPVSRAFWERKREEWQREEMR